MMKQHNSMIKYLRACVAHLGIVTPPNSRSMLDLRSNVTSVSSRFVVASVDTFLDNYLELYYTVFTCFSHYRHATLIRESVLAVLNDKKVIVAFIIEYSVSSLLYEKAASPFSELTSA